MKMLPIHWTKELIISASNIMPFLTQESQNCVSDNTVNSSRKQGVHVLVYGYLHFMIVKNGDSFLPLLFWLYTRRLGLYEETLVIYGPQFIFFQFDFFPPHAILLFITSRCMSATHITVVTDFMKWGIFFLFIPALLCKRQTSKL